MKTDEERTAFFQGAVAALESLAVGIKGIIEKPDASMVTLHDVLFIIERHKISVKDTAVEDGLEVNYDDVEHDDEPEVAHTAAPTEWAHHVYWPKASHDLSR